MISEEMLACAKNVISILIIISTMSRIGSYIKLNSHQCKLLLIYGASCNDRENLASVSFEQVNIERFFQIED